MGWGGLEATVPPPTHTVHTASEGSPGDPAQSWATVGGGDLWDFMGANQKGQLILGTKMSHQAVPLTSKLSPQWGTVERPGPKASVGPTVRAMLLPVLSSSRPLTFLSVVGDGRG